MFSPFHMVMNDIKVKLNDCLQKCSCIFDSFRVSPLSWRLIDLSAPSRIMMPRVTTTTTSGVKSPVGMQVCRVCCILDPVPWHWGVDVSLRLGLAQPNQKGHSWSRWLWNSCFPCCYIPGLALLLPLAIDSDSHDSSFSILCTSLDIKSTIASCLCVHGCNQRFLGVFLLLCHYLGPSTQSTETIQPLG